MGNNVERDPMPSCNKNISGIQWSIDCIHPDLAIRWTVLFLVIRVGAFGKPIVVISPIKNCWMPIRKREHWLPSKKWCSTLGRIIRLMILERHISIGGQKIWMDIIMRQQEQLIKRKEPQLTNMPN